MDINTLVIKEPDEKINFSPYKQFTLTICVNMVGISFIEKELINKLHCTDDIIKIDCCYGHLQNDKYVLQNIKKKRSNRGRKKKIEKKKKRKHGDGSSFDSQIQFTIRSWYENEGRKIWKDYKIKLFRNGKITTTGIITNDPQEVYRFLDILRDYLTEWFGNDIYYEDYHISMINYKFCTNCMIDTRCIYNWLLQNIIKLININFDDVYDFYREKYLLQNPNIEHFIENSSKPKNILISKGNINTLVINVDDDIAFIEKKLKDISNNYQVIVEHLKSYIFVYYIKPKLDEIKKKLLRNKNNTVKYIKFDERSSCLLWIRINEKKTGFIKILQSGKIDMHNIVSEEIARKIYLWFYNLLKEHPEFELVYRDPEYDSEFSYTDEEV